MPSNPVSRTKIHDMLRGVSLALVLSILVLSQALSGQQRPAANADIQTLVARLDLQKYKSTIESLSGFGDRRQGTRRNRDALNWIEAQLKSYGCADVERLKYDY